MNLNKHSVKQLKIGKDFVQQGDGGFWNIEITCIDKQGNQDQFTFYIVGDKEPTIEIGDNGLIITRGKE